MNTRRDFLKLTGLGAASTALFPNLGKSAAAGFQALEKNGAKRPNVVVFTMDDIAFDTVNVFGGKVPGITPNVDRLARGGMRFCCAHGSSAVCQPARQSMMTGLHPHRNGSFGFMPVPAGVPNLSELLMAAGVFTASFSKGRDYSSFKWSWFLEGYGGHGFGRDGKLFVASAREAIQRARAAGQPFYLGVNSSDPHRAFAGSADEQRFLEKEKKLFPKAANNIYVTTAEAVCTPEQAWVPPYLADLPAVRQEQAQYYNTAHHGDQTLGMILDLLETEGVAQDTIVVFFSDHGASFPTSKQNCYPYSTHVPLIIRWPGVVKPDQEDRTHMVSTMDVMPTLLEAYGLPVPPHLDGRTLWPLLKGADQTGRDHVFTTYNYIYPGLQVYPMRAVETRAATYIFNAWSNGQAAFSGECQSGLTFAAMEHAAESDPALAQRVRHIKYREREELYDLSQDPWCLHNLAADPDKAGLKAEMRKLMESEMRATDDPLLPAFLGSGEVPAAWYQRDPRLGKKAKHKEE
ncbi:MAG: twin-arginine translocation signal domain-containing protein [Verrucomicrobia bacterium]|nr:MAG: twin-arginine translocation signal domain-containing protein [Verrucomicrobiota bacterium]